MIEENEEKKNEKQKFVQKLGNHVPHLPHVNATLKNTHEHEHESANV
jgi:hypothetical protein